MWGDKTGRLAQSHFRTNVHLWDDTVLQLRVPLGGSLSEITVPVLRILHLKVIYNFSRNWKLKINFLHLFVPTKAEVFCSYRTYKIQLIRRWILQVVLNNYNTFWSHTSLNCCLSKTIAIFSNCTAFLNHKWCMNSIRCFLIYYMPLRETQNIHSDVQMCLCLYQLLVFI